ncbi:MAG: CopG family transcriptional regulator [Deltaproteobacteria bacterium]|nr:CopG family transcriptional regulator [Deltaproteobacteria bacterium]MBW2175836.1 CopG family transcriptional regulator [Deltaproteobacteria bacterium]MBW2296457.1 CopG family transcriptional regulator [Deltaproteobacteria bacterium]
MIRTQIQLSETQAHMLKQLSAARQESVASLIRKAVDQFLITGKPDRPAMYRLAESVIGKYKAEQSDISTNHDAYLDEAFGT